MRNFRFFFSYIDFLPFLVKFEPHCLPAIRIFWCFSRHNWRKLRQTTCIENREGFAVHSSTRPSGAKGEWRISSWWAISTHVKKYDIFFYVCCYGFSQGQKSLYNTAVYVIINVIILLGQGCVLHSRDRSLSPLHSLPPCAGGGFVHVRELVCDPPPQDFEHLPHWFQTVHPPSTRD